MRVFIRFISLVILTAAAISAVFAAIAAVIYRGNDDYAVGPNKNVIAFGGSMMQYGVDTDILDNWHNMGQNAEHFIHTYPLVERMLDHNPQVDTVIVNVSIPAICGMSDSIFDKRKLQTIRLFQDRVALSDRAMLCDNARMADFVPFIFTSGLNALLTPTFKGGGAKYYSNNLDKDIEWRSRLCDEHGGKPLTTDGIMETSRLQVKYLHKIIGELAGRGVTCILLNTPQYEIDRFYDTRGFDEFMASLPPGVLIADYSRLAMPDSTYFSDVIHLHAKGCEYFSQIIRDQGLRLETPEQYASRRIGLQHK